MTVTYIETGAQAVIDCRATGKPFVHTYWRDRGQWQCSHCGTFVAPEKTPHVLEPSDTVPAAVAAPRPTGVRVQPRSGAAFSIPANAGYRLELVPDGLTEGHSFQWPLDEIERMTVIFQKGAA